MQTTAVYCKSYETHTGLLCPHRYRHIQAYCVRTATDTYRPTVSAQLQTHTGLLCPHSYRHIQAYCVLTATDTCRPTVSAQIKIDPYTPTVSAQLKTDIYRPTVSTQIQNHTRLLCPHCYRHIQAYCVHTATNASPCTLFKLHTKHIAVN
jgi:hypothetical protein